MAVNEFKGLAACLQSRPNPIPAQDRLANAPVLAVEDAWLQDLALFPHWVAQYYLE